MKYLLLLPLLALSAQASLISHVTATTGINSRTVCDEVYMAPAGAPFFDRAAVHGLRAGSLPAPPARQPVDNPPQAAGCPG